MTEPTTDWRRELETIAHTERLLVALDFDGTLAPLQDDPMQSRALPESAAAIGRLAALPATTVAYVSGRSLPDLRVIGEHDDASKVWLAGSHGVEYWIAGEGMLPVEQHPEEIVVRDSLRSEIEAEIADLPGVSVEPKTYGVGIHTRAASEEDARRTSGRVDDPAAQARRREDRKAEPGLRF